MTNPAWIILVDNRPWVEIGFESKSAAELYLKRTADDWTLFKVEPWRMSVYSEKEINELFPEKESGK